MKAAPEPKPARIAGFRTKLFAAIMLVVAAITLLALYFAQRSLVANVESDLQRRFLTEFDALERARDVRYATLIERCRTLARRPRIRAALEDDALDLLYLAAEDELRDLIGAAPDASASPARRGLRAITYWILDRNGTVIAPQNLNRRALEARQLRRDAAIALPRLSATPQLGYVESGGALGAEGVSEIVATPILSSESGEPIAALVLMFRPFTFGARQRDSDLKSGIWLARGAQGTPQLYGTDLPNTPEVLAQVEAATQAPVRLPIQGQAHLLFAKRLNPDSLYPAALEACAFPLDELLARQRQLRWQVLGTGALLLLVGLVASHVIAGRLSAPVEQLAVDSERSARFSADASHQLKTPVTVLRAGLEELLARENLSPAECQEISALIHQTYRLSSLIEDLLLLSRMDAGRLKLVLTPVNLSQLIEASLDDLSALPDEFGVQVETDFPPDLHISGEKRYSAIILQNLLENARKYNQPGGRIELRATTVNQQVSLTVRNSGRPIPAEAQAHIFERFHRGTVGENVPGYGLGLNLARELARLHQGDLRLVRSDAAGTEFEVTFQRADPPASVSPPR